MAVGTRNNSRIRRRQSVANSKQRATSVTSHHDTNIKKRSAAETHHNSSAVSATHHNSSTVESVAPSSQASRVSGVSISSPVLFHYPHTPQIVNTKPSAPVRENEMAQDQSSQKNKKAKAIVSAPPPHDIELFESGANEMSQLTLLTTFNPVEAATDKSSATIDNIVTMKESSVGGAPMIPELGHSVSRGDGDRFLQMRKDRDTAVSPAINIEASINAANEVSAVSTQLQSPPINSAISQTTYNKALTSIRQSVNTTHINSSINREPRQIPPSSVNKNVPRQIPQSSIINTSTATMIDAMSKNFTVSVHAQPPFDDLLSDSDYEGDELCASTLEHVLLQAINNIPVEKVNEEYHEDEEVEVLETLDFPWKKLIDNDLKRKVENFFQKYICQIDQDWLVEPVDLGGVYFSRKSLQGFIDSEKAKNKTYFWHPTSRVEFQCNIDLVVDREFEEKLGIAHKMEQSLWDRWCTKKIEASFHRPLTSTLPTSTSELQTSLSATTSSHSITTSSKTSRKKLPSSFETSEEGLRIANYILNHAKKLGWDKSLMRGERTKYFDKYSTSDGWSASNGILCQYNKIKGRTLQLKIFSLLTTSTNTIKTVNILQIQGGQKVKTFQQQ